MRTSCIRHPGASIYIRIHEWQLTATHDNHCAAALLSLFEHYHNKRLEVSENPQDPKTLLQYHREVDLKKRLLKLYTEKPIRKAIAQLEDLGFITLFQNPNPEKAHDRTRYLMFNSGAVQEWIDSRLDDNGNPWGRHSGKMPELKPYPGGRSGKMPEVGGKCLSTSGKNADRTLYIEDLEEGGEEIRNAPPGYFGAVPEDEEIPLGSIVLDRKPEEAPPSPPAAAPAVRNEWPEAYKAKMISREKGQWNHNPIGVKSGSVTVFPWNPSGNINEYCPYFLRYVMDGGVNFGVKDGERSIVTAKGWLGKIHTMDRVASEERISLARDMWNDSATKRAEWAAEDAKREAHVQRNIPETHPAFQGLLDAFRRHNVKVSATVQQSIGPNGLPNGFKVEIVRVKDGKVLHPMGVLIEYRSVVVIAGNMGVSVPDLFYAIGDMANARSALRAERVQPKYSDRLRGARRKEMDAVCREIEAETDRVFSEYLEAKEGRQAA